MVINESESITVRLHNRQTDYASNHRIKKLSDIDIKVRLYQVLPTTGCLAAYINKDQ